MTEFHDLCIISRGRVCERFPANVTLKVRRDNVPDPCSDGADRFSSTNNSKYVTFLPPQ
ncbi:MAG: hypothetical protein IPP40_10100 [bacterium]|nr:hypothetical protein [bacterium]